MSGPVEIDTERAAKPSFDFQQTRIVSGALADALVALRREIAACDLWILHEIDPQALLARGGFEISAARQILFFHPRYVARILTIDPAALLEAPLKFALLEISQDRLMLRWYDPARSFRRYGDPRLDMLGEELAILCDAITDCAFPRPAKGGRR